MLKAEVSNCESGGTAPVPSQAASDHTTTPQLRLIWLRPFGYCEPNGRWRRQLIFVAFLWVSGVVSRGEPMLFGDAVQPRLLLIEGVPSMLIMKPGVDSVNV
jgi:hypothetical protein